MGCLSRECQLRLRSELQRLLGMISDLDHCPRDRQLLLLQHGCLVRGISVQWHCHCKNCFAIVPTSLSPRPDRFTIIESSFSSVFASFVAKLIACAGSNAGIIPSSCESRLKACSASVSVCVTYFVRPMLIR